MSEFAVPWEELRTIGAKFIDRCRDPSLTCDQLDGAKSAFALHFLNSHYTGWQEASKIALFKICMREYLFRLTQQGTMLQ